MCMTTFTAVIVRYWVWSLFSTQLVALLGGRVRLLASSCLHLKSAATAIRNVAKRILSKSDVGKCENLGALLKHQGQQFF